MLDIGTLSVDDKFGHVSLLEEGLGAPLVQALALSQARLQADVELERES